MSRLEMPAEGEMTPQQTAACDAVRAGRRGSIPAPMIAWLRNPELATRGQRLGELLRFDTVLGSRLTELAILICARHWTSHHEWKAHKRLALEAGLNPDVIAAIAARQPPPSLDAQERMVLEVSSALLGTGKLSAPLYERGTAEFGERGMVELVAVLGYYCLVSLTLNAFELGLPQNLAPELNDLEADAVPRP